MPHELPTFRLHPNVYQLDLFKREAGTCSCCGERRDWKYSGPFYAIQKPDYLPLVHRQWQCGQAL
ncbi:CbrC family protein [Pseudomonas sp. LR_1]|nr:CbrC family protein [Pseudomonas fulva]